MHQVTVVYWRDIPAQILVGKGRRAAKVQLPERFEQAIDRAAMKTGAAGTDAYLAEWRKEPLRQAEGDAHSIAETTAAEFDATYDAARLKTLIDQGGHSAPQAKDSP